MQKKLIAVLFLLWAMPVLSAPLSIKIDSKDTGFYHEPYYVIYLADNKGKFVRTLQLFGYNLSYAKTLRGWYRNATRAGEDIDALSGASLRGGEEFVGDFDIDNTHISQGYKLILETSSENLGNKRQEIVITLDANKKVQQIMGTSHTDSVTVTLK